MLIYSIFDREELELARELRRQFRPAQQRIYTVVFSVRLCDQLFRNSLIHLDASRRGELTRARRPANRQVVRFYIPDTSLSDSITVTNQRYAGAISGCASTFPAWRQPTTNCCQQLGRQSPLREVHIVVVA